MNQMAWDHARPDTQPSTLLGLLGAAHRIEARLESGLAKVAVSSRAFLGDVIQRSTINDCTLHG
jgi:hypothetical protein